MTVAGDTPLTGYLDILQDVLEGSTRSDLIDSVVARGDFGDQLKHLRSLMTSYAVATSAGGAELSKQVRKLDNRTRQDGFRVLHAWNHRTHAFTDDIVPVLMVDFFERAGGETPNPRVTLEILLDYYLLHLLALAAMRAWDEEPADAVLDRVTEQIAVLQGPHGSGHQFVEDAETLLIYALSQFHPDEHSYDRMIERVVTLGETHQLRFARVSAAVLGAHLRWGFWLMYGRDVVRMREDNVGDYPWLLYSVLTLLRGYEKLSDAGASKRARSDVVEGLLQGLAADPWMFTGSPPSAVEAYGDEYVEARGLLERFGTELLDDLDDHRPRKDRYAPLSLHFNFPHNTLVAIVTLALLEGKPQTLPLNALFSCYDETLPGDETQEGLSRTLMAFSRGSPDRLGYQGAMLVAYDPLSAMRSHSMTLKAIRQSLAD